MNEDLEDGIDKLRDYIDTDFDEYKTAQKLTEKNAKNQHFI